jgi:hypothetical protein
VISLENSEKRQGGGGEKKKKDGNNQDVGGEKSHTMRYAHTMT